MKNTLSGNQCSYEEIAKSLNLSVTQVKTIERNALRKLSHPSLAKEMSSIRETSGILRDNKSANHSVVIHRRKDKMKIERES